jgi:kynurenine formamidase
VNAPFPAGSRIVDLTLLLAEELPCSWSTHMPYQQKTYNYFADCLRPEAVLRNHTGPYQTRWLLIDEHTGTHVDAPAHFIPEEGSGLPHAGPVGAVTVEQIPLEQLTGPAVVVDVPPDLPGAAPGISPTVDAALLERFEEQHGAFRTGDVVLLRGRWDVRYRPGAEGDDYCRNPLVLRSAPGWPAPDVSAMELLVDRGVGCVGTDSPSMGSTHDGAPVHQFALGRRVAFIEALGNLGALPVRGAWFCFAPLKVARGTGAPGRAFAFVLPD